MRWAYHASRLILGGWWLFSGLMHFLWPQLQPLWAMNSRRSISRWR